MTAPQRPAAHTAENDALTGVLADEIRMYAHAHGSWLPIDLARNLTKQLRAAGWRVIPPGECRACRVLACEVEGNTADQHTCVIPPGSAAS